MSHDKIAEQLLLMAAKRSTETQFGWSHPDCEVLTEAARIIRGDPPVSLGVPEGVLSDDPRRDCPWKCLENNSACVCDAAFGRKLTKSE